MKIGLATPTVHPKPKFFNSWNWLVYKLQNNGFEVVTSTKPDVSEVAKARNVVVANLLSQDCDYVFFVDDDMNFEPSIVERLLAHKKDFICGIMFSKNWPFIPTIKKINSRDKVTDVSNYLDYPDNKLFEIGGCGMAATLIDRRVFDDTAYEEDVWFKEGNQASGYASEDIGFCFRAREKGYKLWCDSSIKTRHIGGDGIGEENWIYWKSRLPTATPWQISAESSNQNKQ